MQTFIIVTCHFLDVNFLSLDHMGSNPLFLLNFRNWNNTQKINIAKLNLMEFKKKSILILFQPFPYEYNDIHLVVF